MKFGRLLEVVSGEGLVRLEHRRLGLQFAFAGDQLGDLPPWGPMADAYVLTKV
eukprot:SAG11_NODE_25606_length_356_cov_1.190661_1_plen_52_part_01